MQTMDMLTMTTMTMRTTRLRMSMRTTMTMTTTMVAIMKTVGRDDGDSLTLVVMMKMMRHGQAEEDESQA